MPLVRRVAVLVSSWLRSCLGLIQFRHKRGPLVHVLVGHCARKRVARALACRCVRLWAAVVWSSRHWRWGSR